MKKFGDPALASLWFGGDFLQARETFRSRLDKHGPRSPKSVLRMEFIMVKLGPRLKVFARHEAAVDPSLWEEALKLKIRNLTIVEADPLFWSDVARTCSRPISCW